MKCRKWRSCFPFYKCKTLHLTCTRNCLTLNISGTGMIYVYILIRLGNVRIIVQFYSRECIKWTCNWVLLHKSLHVINLDIPILTPENIIFQWQSLPSKNQTVLILKKHHWNECSNQFFPWILPYWNTCYSKQKKLILILQEWLILYFFKIIKKTTQLYPSLKIRALVSGKVLCTTF